MPAARRGATYADAGVDIDAGNEVVQRIRRWVKGTYTPQVVTDSHGAFGGYFRIARMLAANSKLDIGPGLAPALDANLHHFADTKLVDGDKRVHFENAAGRIIA